ncbi:MAG TPA: acyl-ACP--UDP-N-acetylglucosamine O-acyltransferase [Candidatus Polarisedimenticolia bacterium]|jgi:UDP-N-acetylglucosamine acyltransferase|nr:acyl-ACP--UDP-N-acetylglucosamine O-acyltransferase [Candidatus Polarisedimenticolia bacterium]
MSPSARVHPSAQVDPGAALAPDVVVGPFCVVGAGVRIGAGTVLHAHVVVEGPTTIGEQNRLFPFACVGMEPQDLKFKGEPTTLEIGDRNMFRESVTVHRGTVGGGGVTRLGSDNLLMAGTHVAHDCHVGSHVIFANAATLAGHVTVEDGATIGAFSGVHQFCRVGRQAYIGGYSVLTQDAAPYVLTVGNRARAYGINVIGLERKGIPAATIQALKQAYRLLFRAHLSQEEALQRVRSEIGGVEEVRLLADFIAGSERGVIR